MMEARDNLISLAAVAKMFAGRGGKGLAPTTPWRWATRGVVVGGRRVYLEAERVGRDWSTTAAAVARFRRELAAGRGRPVATPTERERAAQEAGRVLEAMGV